MRIGVHVVVRKSRREVFDETQAKRATAVLVSLEFCDSRLRRFSGVKANNTRAARAAAGLVLDLGLLDFANCGEKLNQVLIARRPGKLL